MHDPAPISNQTFLDSVFRDRAENASIWTTCVQGDPQGQPNEAWTGQSCSSGKLPPRVLHGEAHNLFFNVSTVKQSGGQTGRKEANFVGCHVIVLDDVGTKAQLPEGFQPSYLLETSAGNHQAGLILAEPCIDLGLLKRLFSALTRAGLTDRGAQGPSSRYVRLPVGTNCKAKCGPGGFKHRLVQWQPERRFSIDQVISELGLTLDAVSATAPAPSSRSATPNKADEVITSTLLRGEKTRRIWAGEDVGMGGSEADQYLVTRIAYLTDDPGQIERIYSASGRADRVSSDGKAKWRDRKDYRERCIKSARDFVEANPGGDVDEARETVERAMSAAKADGDARPIYGDDVVRAMNVLKRAAPGEFDHMRKAARNAGASLATLDEVLKNEGDGNRLLDADAADLAIDQLGGSDSLIFSKGQFWRWPEGVGVWQRIESDEVVRQAIHAVLPRRQITAGNVSSIFNVLKTKIAREVAFDAQRHGFTVNCANGTLRLRDVSFDEGVKSGFWELGEHRREDYLLSQCPVAWEPSAACPTWLKFLADITRDDDDGEDKRRLICQAIGYSLMATTAEEKFFVLYGPGASNGKSTLLNLIRQLAGDANTTALTLTQLTERFTLAKLQGALVNLCGEIERGETLPDGLVKKLCSGDPHHSRVEGPRPLRVRARRDPVVRHEHAPQPT